MHPPGSQDLSKEEAFLPKLIADLKELPEYGIKTPELYSPNIVFTDPLMRIDGRASYLFNIQALILFFKCDFIVHSGYASAPNEITTIWTMDFKLDQLPVVSGPMSALGIKPSPIVITGKSTYTLNTECDTVVLQADEWDSVDNPNPMPFEGILDLGRQIASSVLSTTPSLETPDYTVLRRAQEYEIRQYKPFMVAETEMQGGIEGLSRGGGFNTLASYIFGEGNASNTKMEMTTPVYTTPGEGGSGGTMSFVIEGKYGDDEDALPKPTDAERVVVRRQDMGLVAAVRFPGLPLDFEVKDNERKLRKALERDGIKAWDGYRLAQYNDPFTPPFLKRNEILINLDSFSFERPGAAPALEVVTPAEEEVVAESEVTVVAPVVEDSEAKQ
ncbi:unnamed protein product [Pedinophyceae sp. YPF-701]|nr:unnamed protein product [Pedinophyceae sp. YPF-701]